MRLNTEIFVLDQGLNQKKGNLDFRRINPPEFPCNNGALLLFLKLFGFREWEISPTFPFPGYATVLHNFFLISLPSFNFTLVSVHHDLMPHIMPSDFAAALNWWDEQRHNLRRITGGKDGIKNFHKYSWFIQISFQLTPLFHWKLKWRIFYLLTSLVATTILPSFYCTMR